MSGECPAPLFIVILTTKFTINKRKMHCRIYLSRLKDHQYNKQTLSLMNDKEAQSKV